MAKITLKNMIVEYSKIFDAEGQVGDVDRGKADSDKKWLRDLSKNPEAKINIYFPDEETKQKLLDAGFTNEVTNPKTGETSTRIKKGNEEFGIGEYIQVKRKINDKREFFNKKTGQEEILDFGGFPRVLVIQKDDNGKITEKEEYNYGELGAPMNGSTADIILDLYNGNPRLEAVGFTEVLEYTGGGNDEAPF